MIQKTILRCTLCHSTDVTCKAHVKPNSNNEFAGYSADDDDIQNCGYCNRCETHVPLEEIKQEDVEP